MGRFGASGGPAQIRDVNKLPHVIEQLTDALKYLFAKIYWAYGQLRYRA